MYAGILVYFISVSVYAIEPDHSDQIKNKENYNNKTDENLSSNSDYENIVKQYETLIQKYPDKKELFYNLGNIKYLNGDSESAIQNYKKSLISSNSEIKADALYNLGNTYYQMGDYKNSINFFKESLSIDPFDKDAQYNYELSKKMLSQSNSQNQQEKDENDNQKTNDDEQNQDNSNDSSGDNSEEQEHSEKNSQNNDDSSKKDQDNSENGSDSQDSDSSSHKDQSTQNSEDMNESKDEGLDDKDSDLGTPEDNKMSKQQKDQAQKIKESKILGKKEAEAILDALKANSKNLKYKKYKSSSKAQNEEKDW
jgi:Ca-activated chloride channel family protein